MHHFRLVKLLDEPLVVNITPRLETPGNGEKYANFYESI